MIIDFIIEYRFMNNLEDQKYLSSTILKFHLIFDKLSIVSFVVILTKIDSIFFV